MPYIKSKRAVTNDSKINPNEIAIKIKGTRILCCLSIAIIVNSKQSIFVITHSPAVISTAPSLADPLT